MAPGWLDAAATRRRRARLLAIALGVLLAHALIGERLATGLRVERAARAEPPRLQAAFVRELRLSEPPALATPAAPPPAAPPPPAAAPRRAARAPQPAASAPPAAAASAPRDAAPAAAAQAAAAAAREEERAARLARALAAVAAAEAATAASAPQAEASAAAPASATAVAAAPPAAATGATGPATPGTAIAAAAPSAPASGPTFEWPPSTRLSYRLGGYVRGLVEGSARVDWLRDGDRYQVHLDVLVGPSFAPIVQRRMSSDGTITAEGLTPRRYDEQTDVAFARGRSVSMAFDDAGVTLADGRRAARLPGVQDTASQFVQMTYLFRTGARRLETGAQIEMPLALPRRVDRWVYDVIGEESLDTPFGTVSAWHLKPRRIGDPSTLSVEAWFAPRLEYLPVRMVIRQGDENFIDLMIERLPQQALPGPAAASAAAAAASR